MVERFLEYLKEVKGTSNNTIDAYKLDLKGFSTFVASRGIDNIEEATKGDVAAYLLELKMAGKSKATVNRKKSSLRAFYKYLISKNVIVENPADDVKTPKIERKPIEYLSVEEIDKLLSMPDDSIKGIRDKAILELMYATGLRAAEVISLNPADVNTRLGFITCKGEVGKARIIPIGSMAKAALEKYMFEAREDFIRDMNEDRPLFVNYFGEPLTRQGLWKILRQYGEKAELPMQIKPQLIRNSFAAHMIENGADIKSLQELLGHEDIMATQVYLSIKKNRKKDVYDKAFPRA